MMQNIITNYSGSTFYDYNRSTLLLAISSLLDVY